MSKKQTAFKPYILYPLLAFTGLALSASVYAAAVDDQDSRKKKHEKGASAKHTEKKSHHHAHGMGALGHTLGKSKKVHKRLSDHVNFKRAHHAKLKKLPQSLAHLGSHELVPVVATVNVNVGQDASDAAGGVASGLLYHDQIQALIAQGFGDEETDYAKGQNSISVKELADLMFSGEVDGSGNPIAANISFHSSKPVTPVQLVQSPVAIDLSGLAKDKPDAMSSFVDGGNRLTNQQAKDLVDKGVIHPDGTIVTKPPLLTEAQLKDIYKDGLSKGNALLAAMGFSVKTGIDLAVFINIGSYSNFFNADGSRKMGGAGRYVAHVTDTPINIRFNPVAKAPSSTAAPVPNANAASAGAGVSTAERPDLTQAQLADLIANSPNTKSNYYSTTGGFLTYQGVGDVMKVGWVAPNGVIAAAHAHRLILIKHRVANAASTIAQMVNELGPIAFPKATGVLSQAAFEAQVKLARQDPNGISQYSGGHGPKGNPQPAMSNLVAAEIMHRDAIKRVIGGGYLTEPLQVRAQPTPTLPVNANTGLGVPGLPPNLGSALQHLANTNPLGSSPYYAVNGTPVNNGMASTMYNKGHAISKSGFVTQAGVKAGVSVIAPKATAPQPVNQAPVAVVAPPKPTGTTGTQTPNTAPPKPVDLNALAASNSNGLSAYVSSTGGRLSNGQAAAALAVGQILPGGQLPANSALVYQPQGTASAVQGTQAPVAVVVSSKAPSAGAGTSTLPPNIQSKLSQLAKTNPTGTSPYYMLNGHAINNTSANALSLMGTIINKNGSITQSATPNGVVTLTPQYAGSQAPVAVVAPPKPTGTTGTQTPNTAPPKPVDLNALAASNSNGLSAYVSSTGGRLSNGQAAAALAVGKILPNGQLPANSPLVYQPQGTASAVQGTQAPVAVVAPPKPTGTTGTQTPNTAPPKPVDLKALAASNASGPSAYVTSAGKRLTNKQAAVAQAVGQILPSGAVNTASSTLQHQPIGTSSQVAGTQAPALPVAPPKNPTAGGSQAPYAVPVNFQALANANPQGPSAYVNASGQRLTNKQAAAAHTVGQILPGGAVATTSTLQHQPVGTSSQVAGTQAPTVAGGQSNTYHQGNQHIVSFKDTVPQINDGSFHFTTWGVKMPTFSEYN